MVISYAAVNAISLLAVQNADRCRLLQVQFEQGDVDTSGVRRHDSNTALFSEDSSL